MNLKNYLFLSLCLAIFSSLSSSAQTNNLRQAGFSQQFPNDSINVTYNQDYFLVEDSCADIKRLGYYSMATRKFSGHFKDVSKVNPAQLIATGSYDKNGLKDGDFISYYINGNLQARGRFKGNMFDGRWEFFYPTGKPRITFIANGSDIKILNTWNDEGKKIVDNGYGPYESIIGAIVWKGTLIGGKPDGKWTAQRMFIPRQEILATERFKLGQLQRGTNQVGDYKDSSRILLVSTDLLPLTKAENWLISAEPCNVARRKVIISAWYVKGPEQFAEEIKNRLESVFNKINISSYAEPIELNGKIQEDGRIIFSTSKWVDTKVTSALVSGLHSLPSLEPARVDGKAVQQDMVMVINFNSSVYSFSYRYLPIKTE